jgi:hypothetical protein
MAERERRRRFVYVTKNREYHVFDEECVGVRDRRTGRWLDDHRAMRQRLEGGVRVFVSGAAIPTLRSPEIGAPMFFHISEDEGDIITSRVEGIARPRLEDLARYPVPRRAAG